MVFVEGGSRKIRLHEGWRFVRALSLLWLGGVALLGGMELARRLGWSATLVHNTTESMPRGIWRLSGQLPRNIEVGAPVPVLAVPPERAHELGCLGRDQLALKYLVAGPGQTVCLHPGRVRIEGAPLKVDPGPAPEAPPELAWRGCKTLAQDTYFLATPHPRSCDSRYWGPSRASELLGVADPVWIWED